MNPQARQEGLTVEELPAETMVYDRKRAKAHCLNRTSALVWKQCDGQTSVSEMARRLHQELGVPLDEELVWLALDRLDKAHLLQERLARPTCGSEVTRRQVMRKLGMVGGLSLLLPVVTSMVAPTPAMAESTFCSTTGGVTKCCTLTFSCYTAGLTGPCSGGTCRATEPGCVCVPVPGSVLGCSCE